MTVRMNANFSKAVIGTLFLASIFGCTHQTEQREDANDAMKVIMQRKSVRHFTGEAVGQDALMQLVRAGMAAPTAVNRQPWSFIIVTKRPMLEILRKGLPYAQMLDKAGAAIVVCADPAKAFQESLEYAILDASCASENILLAAEALGLGAVWTASYPDSERMAYVQSTLNIPDEIIPLAVIPIGHPTGVDKSKDKYKPENVHWEHW